MNDEIFSKISELLLFAVQFQKGDKIIINTDIDQRTAAVNLAELAYQKGAAYVNIYNYSQDLEAAAIKGKQDDFFFPEYLQVMQKETTGKGWKKIALLSEINADIFQGLDSGRSARFFREKSEKTAILRKAVMENRIPWTLTYLPSVSMAKKAFPGFSEEKAVQKYWELIIRIMRLDLDDPVTFWHEKCVNDEKRIKILDSLDIDYLHFSGPGTDLKVGIPDSVKWTGGFDTTLDGWQFMANIPTDEIFTSPDWRRTEGRVSLTRPFVMHQNLGEVPVNAWFEFREGKVAGFGAEKGKESIENLFKIDERAKYIGEVALVDPQSPFAETGITYYNLLYDENAACHLALGKAYPFTLKQPGNFEDDTLQSLGLNTANIHEDMMIGGKEVDVTAVLKGGSRKELIKGGKYLI